MAPDFIERLKASAQHQLYLYRSYHLPIARSESINADSQTPTSYSSEEGLVAGHSRQFTPGGYLSGCQTVKHTALAGIEPTTFRLLVRRAYQ